MAVAIQQPMGGERRRFTVDEYYRMAEAGILKPEDRVELLDGEIVWMSPIGSRHAATVERSRDLLRDRAGGRALVRSQNPLALGEYDEPEPDLALVRPRADYYADAHPGAADVLLVLEVADTTLAPDRRRKLPIYAAAGIRETWLLDLQGDVIEAYRDPGPEGYTRKQVYRRGEWLAPEALPDLVLSVEELLPASQQERQQERPGRARDRGRARGWDLER